MFWLEVLSNNKSMKKDNLPVIMGPYYDNHDEANKMIMSENI
jgi:hypothetical protein